MNSKPKIIRRARYEQLRLESNDWFAGAELMILAQGSHAALIEQPEDINHRLGRFLAQRAAYAG